MALKAPSIGVPVRSRQRVVKRKIASMYPNSQKISGNYSLVVEYSTVTRVTRVRFPVVTPIGILLRFYIFLFGALADRLRRDAVNVVVKTG